MLTIISTILIILAAIVILFIVMRKFPALAILDVTNIPGEKEAKFKERIIKARVERDLSRWTGFFGRIWLFLTKGLVTALRSQQASLKRIKSNYTANIKVPWIEKQKRIRELSATAKEALRKEDTATAEEKLVEIITLDQKNLDAFFQLGEVYETQKKWPEARQTMEYALKLAKQHRTDPDFLGDITLQEIYFSLANVEKEVEDLEAALENIREALELEPNNPRYLDLILDLSIMRKDKSLALECWEKLASVNPENNKLAGWKSEIEKIS